MSVKELMEELDKEAAVLEQKQKDSMPVLFKGLFAEIPNLQKITITGYTPSFNDGDPCYHSQYQSINGVGDDDDYDEDGENSPKESFLELTDEERELINGVLATLYRPIKQKYDTNFKLHLNRSDNEDGYTLQYEDYYCGY